MEYNRFDLGSFEFGTVSPSDEKEGILLSSDEKEGIRKTTQ